MEYYKNEKSKNKLNLYKSTYSSSENKTYVFQVIRQAEKELWEEMESEKINKDYLPIEGHMGFLENSKRLVFGESSNNLKNIASIQTISTTGALYLTSQFLKKFYNENSSKIYLPNMSWENHRKIFETSGFEVEEYPYVNINEKNFDYNNFKNFLQNLNENSIVLLHASGHNPSGIDPSENNWREISEIFLLRGLIPIFDIAYQGLVSGNLDKDALSIRIFNEKNIGMFVTQTYSKNMGLYGERIGALHIVTGSEEIVEKVISQMR